MKLIIAVVRPFTIDRLVVALENIENFPGMTMVDFEGFGQRIRTRDILHLYCTPLRQNGLLESILSKMRICINEKTTMDI